MSSILQYCEEEMTLYCVREADADCRVMLGSRDPQGRLQGNVHLQWSNGDSFKVHIILV